MESDTDLTGDYWSAAAATAGAPLIHAARALGTNALQHPPRRTHHAAVPNGGSDMRKIITMAAALAALAEPAAGQTAPSPDRVEFIARVEGRADRLAEMAGAVGLAFGCRARDDAWTSRAAGTLLGMALTMAESAGRPNDARMDYATAYLTGTVRAARRQASALARAHQGLCQGIDRNMLVAIFDGLP